MLKSRWLSVCCIFVCIHSSCTAQCCSTLCTTYVCVCIVSGNVSETHFIHSKPTKSETAVSLWKRHVSTLLRFVKISVHKGKMVKSLLPLLLVDNNFASLSTSGRSVTDKAWLLCRVSVSKTSCFPSSLTLCFNTAELTIELFSFMYFLFLLSEQE